MSEALAARPLSLAVKLATSHGKPCRVCVEVGDGTNRPRLIMLSAPDAKALACDLIRIAERVPTEAPAVQYPRGVGA